MDKAKTLIKKYEGLKLKAYNCPAGLLTIGYGHVLAPNEPKSITIEQAEILLEQDILKSKKSLLKQVKVTLSENQLSALISFVFNIGIGAFSKSTMLKYINKNDFEKASNEFSKWVRGGGKILPGLVKRRDEEARLFRS